MAAPAYCTTAEVLERLRLNAADRDAAYIDVCREAACELIEPLVVDVDGGPLPEPFPARVNRAAIGVSIRIYRFKDAEADISDAWNGGLIPLRIPRDPLAGYVDLLAPDRHQWGIA